MKQFLEIINEDVRINRLNGATYEKVVNAFLANYMAAMLMLKLQDLKGLMIINDRSHCKLTKMSPQMSDVNFWGLALFYPNNPEVKKRMLPGEPEKLEVEAKHVQHTRVQFMMFTPLTAPSEIHWHEVIASLILIRLRYRVVSSYFRYMLQTLSKWETATEVERKKAISNSFMYLMQSDPHSFLLPRMRMLSTTLLVKGADSVASRVVGFKKVMIEDGEAVSTGNIASSSGSSGGNAIITPPCMNGSEGSLQGLFKLDKLSNNQVSKKGKYVFKDNKIVKKRKKKFEPKKFKAPDFLKKNEAEQETQNGEKNV